MEANEGKQVFLIWDNYKPHKARIVQEYASLHESDLFLISLPPYSPMLNSQEMYGTGLKTTLLNIRLKIVKKPSKPL